MGSYLIPGATTVSEAAAHLKFIPPPRRIFTLQPGGVYFSDPMLTDAECEALFANFTPVQPTEEGYVTPVPPAVAVAFDFLANLYAANPASMTDAQTAAAIRNILIALRWMNRRLVEEGY